MLVPFLFTPWAYCRSMILHLHVIGSSGWTDANGHGQSAQEADVKVLLWLQDWFPSAAMQVGWTSVDSLGSIQLHYISEILLLASTSESIQIFVYKILKWKPETNSSSTNKLLGRVRFWIFMYALYLFSKLKAHIK